MLFSNLTRGLMAAAVIATAAPAAARIDAGGWERLGSRTVELRRDTDIIPVTVVRGDFKRVRLAVRNNAVRFRSMDINYGNGVTERFVINERIPAGSRTRAFDLRGGDRVIRAVQLNYRAAPTGRSRAIVELWGKH